QIGLCRNKGQNVVSLSKPAARLPGSNDCGWYWMPAICAETAGTQNGADEGDFVDDRYQLEASALVAVEGPMREPLRLQS
ncbi:hypothetical protein, partial [Mesorhizobium sp.]